MTRIIAGAAGSVTLKVPGHGTRPTSDKVREALFSALDARGALDDAHVLDLYAGSGALGLEAASRGASVVVLVEKSRAAAAIAAANAKAVAAAGAELAQVVTSPVERFVRESARTFDLVFLDPPYDLDSGSLDAVLAEAAALLTHDALVLVERDRRSAPPTPPDDLTIVQQKSYGDTVVYWLAKH